MISFFASRRLRLAFAGLALAPMLALAQAERSEPAPVRSAPPPTSLQAGRDYLVLANPRPAPEDRLEVSYFFWFNSPGSAKLDPHLRHWVQNRASPFVIFRPIPAILDVKWGYGARVFFALQRLRRDHDLTPKLMQAIDKGIVDYNSPKSLSTWLAENGVDRQDMSDAINDSRVVAQTSWIPGLMRQYGVERVPTVVLDGTYLFVYDPKDKPEDFVAKISFAAESLTKKKLEALAQKRKQEQGK